MKNIGPLFFTFYLILFFSANAEIGKYPIKNFTPEEYGAGIQNIDFAQNRDMNLFVANNLGVLSFNGNHWEAHAFNTGKKQRSLAFDEKTNRLYVGSQSDFGYFDRYWNYVSLLHKIPAEERGFDDVWDVFIDGLNIYFCTFQAIFVFDGQSVSFIKKNSGFNRSFFSGNRLFTQSPLGELYEVEGLQISTTLRQGQKKKIVTGVIQHESGHLIFYNSGNIEFSTRYNVKDVFPELANVLKGNYVNHVLQLSDSRLVIATQQAGLFLYDLQSNLIENMTAEEGLQTNACLRTFQDNTGNLWVGMQNGIALVDINSPLKLINQDIELQGSGYEAFDTDQGTYYTTSNGIFYRAKASNKSKFIKGTQGPAYGIQMINNKIYAGHHTGLFLLENGLARRIAITDGLWVVKQYRAKPEYAIGGTYSGFHLFRINEQGELDEVQKIDGFSETSRFFEEDRKGRLWVGQYYKGLYQLTLNETLSKIDVSRTPDSFDLNIGKNVILSRIDDELYLGTNEGLYKIDQSLDKIIAADHFTDVVGNSWVYLIAQDKQKNVHIFSEDLVGFFKQVSTNNYAYIPSSLYQLRQSFNNDLLTVSTNTHSGVFFNANEGFIHYSPNLEEVLTIEKQPVVNRVYSLVEDSLVYSRTPFQSRTDSIISIKIIQGTKALKFYVESFKYKDVNNRQFRYYLKGFDNAYGEWSSAPFKEYTNLREGSYEFFVQANNHLGEIVTSIPLVIEVEPPFYKSTIAKTFYALLIVSILGMTYRLQRRYYKGKQLRIEKVKKEELAEKQQELKMLREEKIEDELRHLNNLLASSTMNLVVKNEFMENIKEEIKQVNLNGQVIDTQKALKRIIREIDTTLKVQEDWKQFEYHFDRVHGDFLTRLTNEFLDLTPGEQKLCAFLRLKMDTKEIANLMGISLRGVEVARYRLRKKLGLDKHQNLSKYILEY